jgi:hypothetical protein
MKYGEPGTPGPFEEAARALGSLGWQQAEPLQCRRQVSWPPVLQKASVVAYIFG